MLSRRAALASLLVCLAASPALPRQTAAVDPLGLGKAALDAHDPTAAIAHFERAEGKQARAWLAVALMMESRAPSDPYVERAYDAAVRARADRSDGFRSRAELAAALRPGEMVITYLFTESHAYGWAFDRDTMVGYPLPRPREMATVIERLNAYRAGRDRAGVGRVADELVPALLGPVLDRKSSPTRLVVVPDGPMRDLPLAELFSAFGMDLPVSTTDDAGLLEEIRRTPPRQSRRLMPVLIAAGIAGIVLLALVSRLTKRRSRAPS